MAKWLKIALSLMLSLSFCTLCVGYAQISTSLDITGSATFTQPPIYISNTAHQSGGTYTQQGILNGNILQSRVVLGASAASTAVVAVTVKNRTTDDYGYNGTFTGTDSIQYSNPNIIYTVYADAACKQPLAKKTALYPQTTADGADGLTFYVKFSYKKGYTPTASETLDSFLHFDFKTPIDSIIDDTAVDHAVNKFEDILNDHINDADYDTLMALMNGSSTIPNNASDRNISYVGNTGTADVATRDKASLNNLFDGQLSMNIEGTIKEVKFILKRENIDGNTTTGGETFTYRHGFMGWQSTTVQGPEMVLYMTSDPLESNEEVTVRHDDEVTVYAMVYTSYDGGEKWVQIGETYKGKATVCSYSSSYSGTGSFNTDTWRSEETYHNVASGAKLNAIIAAAPKD